MKKISLSNKILLGVLLGVLLGLFLGERVAWLSVGGDIFVGLLQMTVLPYIMFSLIVNIGRLSMAEGRKLIRYGLLFLGMLLGIGLIGLAILPLAFPIWETGSFYSADFIQEPAPFDLVKNYIPANPFESMSANIVPAVVVFSIFVGLGLMKIPNKEALLKPLDVLNSGLNQVNKIVVKITPIGVFCIAVGVVSELSWTEISQLQGYLIIYLLAVLLLTFLVLPYVISVFTPYSSKTVLKLTKSTLITIFATGKIIVVYPQLIENIKDIIKLEREDSEQAQNEVDIIMPLAYPFPNLGTLMIFIFIPFAAWFSGNPITWENVPVFLSSTLLSSFVAPITGLPFSLDLMEIPKDTFQLFVVSTVLTDRIRVVLGAFHLITLTLLTIAASNGFLRFNMKKLVPGLVISVLVSTASIFGMHYVLQRNMKNIPSNKQIVNEFKLITPEQPYKILDTAIKNPYGKWRGENTLSRIKRLKAIRIGFYPNSVPFSFYNNDSLLVGFGIDLAHQLAMDLNVSIEFVPIETGNLLKELNMDYFDIVMSDVFISSNYAEEIQLSKPYMDVSLALLVDKEKTEFRSFETAQALDTFTVAYFERAEIAEEFLTYFPHAGAYPIQKLEEFTNNEIDSLKLDAYLTSAERASALTIFYPDYMVVNPLPYHINNALVFPLAKDNVWRRYIDKWIDYRKQTGTFNLLYKQWILGKENKPKEKHWNIYDAYFLPPEDSVGNYF